MKPTFIVPITTLLAVIVAGCAGGLRAETKADVASLAPADIAEFDEQPARIQKLLTYALELTKKNLRYNFGSNDPKSGGMDCSGTVNHILNAQGFSAPRQSDGLYLWVQKNGNLKRVENVHSPDDAALKSLKPGDLLFWEGTYNVGKRNPPTSHVMIYLGKQKSNGKPVMVGASSGRYYAGRARHGVSVFDFDLPRRGSSSVFVGYGPVPGLERGSVAVSN